MCEPETGKILGEENELGSVEDLKNCQEDREEIAIFQVAKELISAEDIRECHEDSQGISHFQLGNKMRSLRDLKDYQEGSGSISDCQEGRDEHLRLFESLMDSEMSSIQQQVLMKMGSIDLIVYRGSNGSIPYFQVGRDEQMGLYESLINSEMDLDQQMQLTEEKDQDNILMIGGIGVFLPFAQEEGDICVADVATIEGQLAKTLKEVLEQISEAAQGEAEEDDEHFEEWLNIFSQEAEKTATWEFAAEEKDVDNICFVDLWE
jgi:hypothetical protein